MAAFTAVYVVRDCLIPYVTVKRDFVYSRWQPGTSPPLGLDQLLAGRLARVFAELQGAQHRSTSGGLGFFKCPEITDDGVIKLAGLTELEMLFLNNNEKLTSRIVNPLCGFSKLTRLELDKMKLGAKDVAELVALRKLETLGLSKARIDDEAASHLAKIGTLTIQEAAITDEGIMQLAQLRNLRALGLSKTTITDRGVAELTPLYRLESPGLSDTKITDRRRRNRDTGLHK